MINTVIIEDIVANREALIELLQMECPDVVKILGEAETVEKGYQLILETKPHLVFLDIQLKDGTGFDILSRFHTENRLDFEIIFFTAHGNFENATKAIEYSALEFITKPVNPTKLSQAIKKAEKKLAAKSTPPDQYHAQITLLLENLRLNSLKAKRIAIHLVKGIIEFVEVADIIYLQADGAVTKVFLKDGQQLTAMKNLGSYSKLLIADYQYFLISHSTLVNLDYVKRYNHAELTVYLSNGNSILASRRGGQDFKKFLTDNKSQFGKIENSSLGGFFRKMMGGG